MNTTQTTEYVQSIEMKYNGTMAVFHCAVGDEYWAGQEDGKWYLQFIPGDPSEGPFEDIEAVRSWLNTEQ